MYNFYNNYMIALESKFDSKNLSDWYNNINFYILSIYHISCITGILDKLLCLH